MPVCASKTENNQAVQNLHCNEHAKETPKDKSNQVMLFADCMGIDLQTLPHSIQIDKAQASHDLVFFDNNEAWSISAARLLEANNIRGSPASLIFNTPETPVFLTTRRLRI